MLNADESTAKILILLGLALSLLIAMLSYPFTASAGLTLTFFGLFFVQLFGVLICSAKKHHKSAFLFACGPLMAYAGLPILGIFANGQLASAIWYLLFRTKPPWA